MIEKLVKLYLAIGHFFIALFKGIIKLLSKWLPWIIFVLITIILFWALVSLIYDCVELRDDDKNRGVAAIVNDPIDQDIKKEDISYLPQNWTESESLWFYRATQGSNLLPYDFFLKLEQANSANLFRENTNINNYRYLPQVETTSNLDALPVGMTKDTYNGKSYMGFTCAACHTSQINYYDKTAKRYKGIRIDGGPGAGDLELFLSDLAEALAATRDDNDKLERFLTAVVSERGDYKTKESAERDLKLFATRIKTYTEINKPIWNEDDPAGTTHYGFSRLDAFGRIYNRVLQYLISGEQLNQVLEKHLPPPIWAKAKDELQALADGKDKTNLVLRSLDIISAHVGSSNQDELDSIMQKVWFDIYNPANAPASYPYLWDVPQHDYVQWTGLVTNGGIGPLGRNVGQVIGVFGTLDWQEKSGWSLSSWLAGQDFNKKYINFRSSINKRNLVRVEGWLKKLQSPEWPDVLGKIDQNKAAQGKRCASCHTNIVRDDPRRRVVTRLTRLDDIETDPVLAKNSTSYKGYSGLVHNEYVDTNMGKMVIEQRHPVASLVRYSTANVVTSMDPDKWPVRRFAEWLWDLREAGRNPVKETARRGNHDAATPEEPFKYLESYKARSLNGIWATAPYLHNGSVPNLYELLLPKKREGDPELDDNGEKIEYRSNVFWVGSREFDPIKVGFRQSGYPENTGFRFDTSLKGNFNTGHEYAAGRTKGANGKKHKPLTKPERYQLLEYLKGL